MLLAGTANTYLGNTIINGGTLGAAADGSLGSSGTGSVSIGAATLLSTGTLITNRSINLNDPSLSTLDALFGDAMYISGVVGGVGNLNVGTSGGGIILLNTANTYLGNTIINSGVLGVEADGSLGTSGGSVTINGATLEAVNSFTTGRSINLNDPNATVDALGFNTMELDGTISGSGNLTKKGLIPAPFFSVGRPTLTLATHLLMVALWARRRMGAWAHPVEALTSLPVHSSPPTASRRADQSTSTIPTPRSMLRPATLSC